MHKKTLFMFVLPIFTAPQLSPAANITLNGFLDIRYVLADSIKIPANAAADKFHINAEIDGQIVLAEQVIGRIDLDLSTLGDYDYELGTGSGHIEQAFISWEATESIAIKGGVFNNPLGREAEDTFRLPQITHGQIYDFLNSETILYGNNIAGIACSGMLGPATITGALLNDLGGVPEKHSFAAVVGYQPVQGAGIGLEFELGLLTQNSRAGTIVDLNGAYRQGMFDVQGELLFADQMIDFAGVIIGRYKANEQLSGTVRFDYVNYQLKGIEDTLTITFTLGYLLDRNLMAKVEIRLNDDANQTDSSAGIIGDGELIQIEFVASF